MLKSELERSARRGLDTAMEAVGLLPFKGRAAAWRSADKRLIVWVVDDSKARDPYRGHAFTIEFEHSHDGSWMKKLAGRARIGGLVSDDEFVDLVRLQNHVITSLGSPPASHVATFPESLRNQYLTAFNPIANPSRGQFWMRFATEEHLGDWWSCIAPLLPTVVARAWTLDPHTLQLGKELQW
jgi:hypothetical protein